MCGIAGIASWRDAADLGPQVASMIKTLTHRGPDDSGLWSDPSSGIGLGQRRLSIIDLSPHGHQPMASASGRYQIVYNGEIYNFATLRDELERSGHHPAWRGHSDTEVLLAAIEAWGLEAATRKFVGMFAIALWDKADRSLSLVRDRMGEKPIYYGRSKLGLIFGSELKALKAVSAAELQIDPDALQAYMQFGYVPGPSSIYRGVRKLPPGHLVTFKGVGDIDVAPLPYWQIEQSHSDLSAQLASMDDKALLLRLRGLLNDAVTCQMVSDVPLGAFLSGGVDSSTVVALMQANSSRPIRTFTIGFDQPAFNEAPYASAVARHLGTDHTELFVADKDAENLVPRLAGIYDEPFADSSQIPTLLVSSLTRQHVTVSLSGDGGDELFGGYTRYHSTQQLWNRISVYPQSLRNVASNCLSSVPAPQWDKLLLQLPRRYHQRLNGHRLHRLARQFRCSNMGQVYTGSMTQWHPEECLVHGATPPALDDPRWNPALLPLDAMRRWDLSQYLPDDILVKVDRASMHASLEARAPLLDHRIVEFALALPHRMLERDGKTKWALRQVLYDLVPQQLIERPKRGFAAPIGEWLRGPLRAWAEDLILNARRTEDHLLDISKLMLFWNQHRSGMIDRAPYLWTAFSYLAWQTREEEYSPRLP